MIINLVIPAYEPDYRLIQLLHSIENEHLPSVILIDDGSGKKFDDIFDQVEIILKRTNGKLIRYPINKGKGAALKTAFSFILRNQPNVEGVITVDSDGQHSAKCIKNMVDAMENNPNHFVLGVREFNLKGIPWKSRIGNKLTKNIFNFISGLQISDTQTGLRGIPREFMKELLKIKNNRFDFEMEMLLNSANKYHIIEIPIETIYDSAQNHQTHFDPLKDSIKIYKVLIKRFVKFIFSSFSSSLIDIALFILFNHLFKTAFPNIYVIISTILARIISATYNYFVNYKVVFSSNRSVILSGIKYSILAIFQMLCSAFFVYFLVCILPSFSNVAIKIFVDITLFFISYYLQQKYVFK